MYTEPLDETVLVALAAIVGLVIAGQLLVADPMVRYGIGLVGFSLWMAWFVLTTVRWLSLRA